MKKELRDLQLKIFETFSTLCDMEKPSENHSEEYKKYSGLLRDYIKQQGNIIRQVVPNDIKKKGRHVNSFSSDYCVVDIETTGLNWFLDEIIELSAIKIRDNVVVEEFTTLVRPSKKIGYFIENLTGINDNMLQDAPNIDEVIGKYCDFIGEDIVLGYNVNFDLGFIRENLKKYKDKPFTNDYTDLMAIAKNKIRNLSNYKLATVADFLKVDTKNMHRGLKDCQVTLECTLKLKSMS